MNAVPVEETEHQPLTIDDVRLISELRVMHSKVDELFELVHGLQSRHHATAIRDFADARALEKDIARVDTIYLWFVGLKDESRLGCKAA